MAHFHDLAPCTYFHGRHALPPLLAVGWLEPGHVFATGEVPADLLTRLTAIRRSNKMPWPYFYMGGVTCWCGDRRTFSTKNLFIPTNGVIYASPEGVIHYIAAHSYRPPDAFIEAVLAAPDIESPEYGEALRAAGWPEEYLVQWRPDYETPR
jgi:hypothetical protein